VGAIHQYRNGQNNRSLLDGIIPYLSFPDTVTYVPTSSDCSLLVHAFDQSRQPWTAEQKSAVTGFATWRVCSDLAGYGFAVSARNCDPAIPKGDTYDPVDRPKGARCDIYDNEINVFGRDPQTGFAARPLDNVGVQYGFTAFNSGTIDAEQFVELNELVGGLDPDGNIVSHRTEANAEVIQRAYRNGRVLSGGGGLPETPIIDWRWYSDDQGDNHDSLQSFITRARLVATNGSAANQVILIDPPASTYMMVGVRKMIDTNVETSVFARRQLDLVEQMDHWLSNVSSDHAAGTPAEKVARDKPADLADACWAVNGRRIAGTAAYDAGECKHIYPQYAHPRIVAGTSLASDILKCDLKPLSYVDYARRLTGEQMRRLGAVFPSGVCDYSRPGLGQQIVQTTWQQYGLQLPSVTGGR